MVAIAIIIVLMGIVVLGFRGVSTGAQKNQTKSILERLRSMQATLTGNKAASDKLFQLQIPAIYRTPVNSPDPPATLWESVPANSKLSTLRTAYVLKQLQTSSEAKAVFDELPANRKKTISLDPTTGDEVASNTTGAVTAVFPLDAWGNPVLYVFDNWQVSVSATLSQLRTTGAAGGPTGGLTNLESAASKIYWQPTAQPPTVTYTPPTAAGWQSAGTAYRSPDRQPFWVSAGADGNFQTHDDNVYSFEN